MKISPFSTAAARWFLILLPLSVVAFQMYFSQCSTLNRWKGGGFGMYSAPHPDHRAIWIEIKNGLKTERIKVFPLSPPGQSPGNKPFQVLDPLIPQLLVFPSSVDFSTGTLKTLRHQLEDNKGKPVQLRLLVTELHWDLDQRQFLQTLLYQHAF